MNSAFNGTWTGTTTVSFPGVVPFSYSSELVIAVSGSTATVSAICPDGSGSITSQGSGDSAQWHGSYTCPAIPVGGCSAVTLTFQNANLMLNANGTLTASGSGVASGCGGTSAVTLTFNGTRYQPVGSAIVYWDFLRNAPAQPGGAVLYDDATLVHAGTGPCAQSAVEVVTIDIAEHPQFVVDCVYQGVQGATLDGLMAGSPSARIRGWRGDFAVYDRTVALQVFDRQETDQGIIDVDAVQAPIDLLGDLAFGSPPTTYASCAQADVPNISFELWDSYGTKIDSGTVGCLDPLPAPVFVGDLDLDNYAVRMQGTATQGPFSGQKTFDSCRVAFDHFGAQMGTAGVTALLLTQPVPQCQ